MSENERQVGGDHYKTGGEEHWDRVARLGLDYFQGQITKYVERWKKKNGIEDLRKAQHFLAKYIEIEEAKAAPQGAGRIRCMNCEKPAVVYSNYGPYCEDHENLRSGDANHTSLPAESPSRLADDAPNYSRDEPADDHVDENSAEDINIVKYKRCLLCGAEPGHRHRSTCDRFYRPPLIVSKGARS